MMRESRLIACRTKSLPVEDRPRKKPRKVKPRVSFSSLPPSKFEFECEIENPEAICSKETILNAKKVQLQREKSGKRKELASVSEDTPSKDECPNDLDSVNEMLMDIIEEIEAENVTVEGCLRDAVSLKALDVTTARQVLPDFEHDLKVGEKTDLNNNGTAMEEISSESKTQDENALDKLLDIFSTLKTEDLAKCCKYTLGKLCQLTSYQDYKQEQMMASRRDSLLTSPSSLDSKVSQEDSSSGSEFPDDSSTSCLSSNSSENLEYSSNDSEKEFPTYDSESHILTLQDTLPRLVEEKVLRSRQVWEILSAQDTDEILRRFMNEVSTTCGEKVLENISNSIDKDMFHNRQQIKEDENSDQGYSSYQSESDYHQPIPKLRSTQKRNNITRKFSKNLSDSPKPFLINSAKSQSLHHNRRTSTPVKRSTQSHREHVNDQTLEDQDPIKLWCRENGLPVNTAYVLRCHGYQTEDRLLILDSTKVQKLVELTWTVRTRLWVALETLKLERQYAICKEKLYRCSKALSTTTPPMKR